VGEPTGYDLVTYYSAQIFLDYHYIKYKYSILSLFSLPQHIVVCFCAILSPGAAFLRI
jgi:hypothetical protein